MKNIKHRFDEAKRRFTNLGDYIIFTRAVKNQRLSRKAISLAFSKLVNKEEYERADRNKLIDQLERASNPLYDGDLQAKFRPRPTKILMEQSYIISSIK